MPRHPLLSSFSLPRPRVLVGVGSVGFILVIVVVLVATSRYPIAIVNGAPISRSRFDVNYHAAAAYYERVRGAMPPEERAARAMSENDLGAAVLDQLVSASLVTAAARAEVGRDLADLVSDKVSPYEGSGDLAKDVQGLYDLSFDDFRNEVLIPQAENDILAGRLFLRGIQLNDWLTEARRNARVTVLSSRFTWNGTGVVAR